MTPTPIVRLSSSFEEDGRQYACPMERVTFTCQVNPSPTIRLAAEPFICRSDPVSFVASDSVGSSGITTRADRFQANLTNVQPNSSQPLIASFTATLTANTTDETSNTVVECADSLDSDRLQRKNLTRSCKTKKLY